MNCDVSPRGPVLFNIFIINIVSEIECTFRKLPGDTKLTGAGDTIEKGSYVQSDLDKLENWAHIIE